MQVSLADTPMAGFERHTFKCPSCSHISPRLVLSRPRPPSANPPVVQPLEVPRAKLQMNPMADRGAPTKLTEKLRSRQRVAQARAAAASTWTELFETLRSQDTPVQKPSGAGGSSTRVEAFAKIDVQNRTSAPTSSTLQTVENHRSPQTAGQVPSATPRTSTWPEAVENIRGRQSTLQDSAVASSAPVAVRVQSRTLAADAPARGGKKRPSRSWAEVVDEIRRRQAALKEQVAADTHNTDAPRLARRPPA